MNKVVKAGIGYTVANYMIKGLAFFTLPIFTRLLTTSDFGVYNTFLAYENILAIILSLSFYSSFNAARFHFDSIEKYISSCISFSAVFSIVLLLLSQVLFPIICPYIKLNRWFLALLFTYSYFASLTTYYNSYVGLTFQYKKFIVISSISAISNITVSLLLITTIFDSNRGLGRIVGMSITTIALGLCIMIYFFSKNKPNLDISSIKYALAYCLPVIPHSISQIILNQFDRIMITSMVGESESGIYSFAYTLFSILLVTVMSFEKVWSPWFFNSMKNEEHEAIKKRSTQFGGLMGLLSVGLLLVAPEIINFLGPDAYRRSIECVRPIIIAGFFSFLYYIPCQVEYYYGKTKFIAFGSVAAAVINIILNFIFIRQYGYVAAAYTTLASYLLYFIFHYIISIKIARRCLFDSWKLAIISISVVLFAIVSAFLSNRPLERWFIAIVVASLSGLYISKEIGFEGVINRLLKR